MCVIVHKESGVTIPTDAVLEDCFTHNSHGAGMLIRREGADFLEIHKGFLTWKKFLEAKNKLEIQENDDVVFHFRITTSGGTCSENCHPFPISSKEEDLRALRINTTKALVHNGIIGTGTKELSDTQLFVRDVLANEDVAQNLEKKEVQEMITKFTTGNKYVLVDVQKNIITRLGYGWTQDSTTKIWFSNRLHEYAKNRKNSSAGYSNYGYYGGRTWKDGTWSDDDFYGGKKRTKPAGVKTFGGYTHYPTAATYPYNEAAYSATSEKVYCPALDCDNRTKAMDKLITGMHIYVCPECGMIFNSDEKTFYDNATRSWKKIEEIYTLPNSANSANGVLVIS